MVECAIDNKTVPENIKNKYLIPAFNSGKFLMNIINDILDFSQINANSLRLVFIPNNIRDTIKNCCELIEIQAQKKNVALIIDIDNSVPKVFNTDHNRLTQIILNLLSNSLKFTYQGYIKIKVYMQNEYLGVSVEDTGIGIKKENLKELFKPFTKLNLGDKAKMNCVGVGLGLSISNTLAKCLGPSNNQIGLSVESIPEIGTKFTFSLEEKKEFCSFSPNSSYPSLINNPNHTSLKGKIDDIESIDKLSEHNWVASPNELSMSNSHFGTTNDNKKKFIKDISSKIPIICKIPWNGGSNIDNLEHTIDASPREKLLNDSDGMKNLDQQNDNIIHDDSCKCEKILIVDDDCFNLLAMENLLKKYGMSCAIAYHGGTAIDKIIERQNKLCGKNCQQFETIFMDCNMPIMDGLETTKRLKQMMSKNEIKSIRIIGCTSFSGSRKTDECLLAGMDDIISKPFSSAKLEEILFKKSINKPSISGYL